ncbi:DUF6779 domain-containing protein [Nocardia aurantiaca]|uniref:DUF6779 domain-containing protein n=1 Tax=Nocardia aurantiaca TaxID=2675850 RepID=A0A6I3KQZ1_9NOCA|nr:DUF6779 domain-containing protein [Nocardia aurantiaca]MTE12312.1 hypothetical protein [Nocardia aurantiaca]
MVSPSRSSASRRRREDAGKFFTGFLLLLGLVASVFLVFSDNLHLIRVGLVAALWAAAIGALAATRYRREAAIDKAKVGDLQKVYQLQLEREVAARREYELGVETRVRHEVGADAAEMAALRAELTVLRESLQRLFDGDLPSERPALRADAVRVQELPSSDVDSAPEAANDNWTDADPWDPWSSPDQAEDDEDPRSRMAPKIDPSHPEPPAFATPFDDPVTAETSIITDAMRQDYEAERANAEPGSPGPASSPEAANVSADLAESDTLAAGHPTRNGHAAANDNGSASIPRLTSEPTPSSPVGRATTRRRRRSDEGADSEGTHRLSVAEIMANLRSENSN